MFIEELVKYSAVRKDKWTSKRGLYILTLSTTFFSFGPNKHQNMRRFLFLFHLAFLQIFLLSGCQNTASKKTIAPAQLLRVPIQSQVDQKERDFFLYLPKGYTAQADTTYPVLLFLHGNGERGNGKEELDYAMIHGPLYEAWVQKRDLPFILLVPQLPMFGMDQRGLSYIDDRDTSWIPRRLAVGTPDRPQKFPTPEAMNGAIQSDTFPGGIITLPVGWDKCELDLLAMLDHVFDNYQGDKKRTYLSGLSYGGFGTWWMASKHPELFAAINPVVGWGHPDLMAPIAKHQIPIWAFAGGRDGVVPVRYFYQGLNRLEELGHTDLRFTVHEDMGHDAWRRVYGGNDLYDWLLSHVKD